MIDSICASKIITNLLICNKSHLVRNSGPIPKASKGHGRPFLPRSFDSTSTSLNLELFSASEEVSANELEYSVASGSSFLLAAVSTLFVQLTISTSVSSKPFALVVLIGSSTTGSTLTTELAMLLKPFSPTLTLSLIHANLASLFRLPVQNQNFISKFNKFKIELLYTALNGVIFI